MAASEPAQVPEVNAAAADAGASATKASKWADSIPPDEVIEKYLVLGREKLLEALLAAGFAGLFRLACGLLKGHYKGEDLLAAIRLLDAKFGLPKFTKEDITGNRRLQAWKQAYAEKGIDIEPILNGVLGDSE